MSHKDHPLESPKRSTCRSATPCSDVDTCLLSTVTPLLRPGRITGKVHKYPANSRKFYASCPAGLQSYFLFFSESSDRLKYCIYFDIAFPSTSPNKKGLWRPTLPLCGQPWDHLYPRTSCMRVSGHFLGSLVRSQCSIFLLVSDYTDSLLQQCRSGTCTTYHQSTRRR